MFFIMFLLNTDIQDGLSLVAPLGINVIGPLVIKSFLIILYTDG